MTPLFPLPKGYFGDVEITPEYADQLRRSRDMEVASCLRDEQAFVHQRNCKVDEGKWKSVMQKKNMHVYQRKGFAANSMELGHPTFFAHGRVEGTVEDLIYGSYDSTHEQTQITNTFLDMSTKDCTVLANVEMDDVEDDPFHYLGVKWLVTKFSGIIVAMRDWCFIEASGIRYDDQGRRYGFFYVLSVEHPSCPPFKSKKVIRGRVNYGFIYRDAGNGICDVYAQGTVDPAGSMFSQLIVIATAEMLTGMFRSVACAEAKKLTILALSNRDTQSHRASPSKCNLCDSKDGIRKRLKPCRVCKQPVCQNCRVKKSLFVGRHNAIERCHCCQNCIIKVKRMNVRPAQPEFSILGAKVLSDQERSRSMLLNDTAGSSRDNSAMYLSHDGSVSSSSSYTEPSNRYELTVDSDAEMESALAAYVQRRGKAIEVEDNLTAMEVYDVPPSPQVSGNPADKYMLYRQMLALQSKVQDAYDTTKANERAMHHPTDLD